LNKPNPAPFEKDRYWQKIKARNDTGIWILPGAGKPCYIEVVKKALRHSNDFFYNHGYHPSG